MGSPQKNSIKAITNRRLIDHFVSRVDYQNYRPFMRGVNHKTDDFFFFRLREIVAYELEAKESLNKALISVL